MQKHERQPSGGAGSGSREEPPLFWSHSEVEEEAGIQGSMQFWVMCVFFLPRA